MAFMGIGYVSTFLEKQPFGQTALNHLFLTKKMDLIVSLDIYDRQGRA